MDTVWYFAYGSNMASSTLRGRRGIEFRQALPARVTGWRLVLDKPPFLPLKQAFANIVPDPSASVLGVLFEVTHDEFDHIELTEGVRIGNYQRVEVEAEPLAASALSQRAFSLTSERRDPGLLPSTRYMGLLIAGALEHGLPVDYVEYLRGVPARDEDAEVLQYRHLIETGLRRTR